MATIDQLTKAAERAGFIQTRCAHPERMGCRVFDYPKTLDQHEQGYEVGPFYRVHISWRRGKPVVYICGTGVGTRTGEQRVSAKNAIDFVKRNGKQDA